MAITDPLILPSDVLLIPVAELPESVRQKVSYKEGDFAITRPHVRTPSKIVDAHAAELLKGFQTAKTIVEAILTYSQSKQEDPNKALEEALPLIKNLIDSRLLVSPDSTEAEPIRPTLSEGDSFAGFEIRGSVQILEDTELYQARSKNGSETDLALKILRDTKRSDLFSTFKREAAILKHLDGRINLHLVETGVNEDRPFLAIEWFYGVPLPILAAELRQLAANADDATEVVNAQERLQRLVVSLLENYSQLHEQGVLHSDVHPNNLLVNDAGEIKILDFGLARFIDADQPLSKAPRGGVGFFLEPECARAMLAGKPSPPSSAVGEQYAVAAIAYELLTGSQHIDFSLRNEEMLAQIVDAETLPFSAHGLAPWPQMEQVLTKALSKDPGNRFASLREFAEAVRNAPPVSHAQGEGAASENRSASSANRWKQSKSPRSSPSQLHESFIQNILHRFRPEGELFQGEIGAGHPLPTCSANYGSAGIAYGLLRLACNRDDSELLAWADLWISKTLSVADREDAFYNKALEITKDTVSEVSVHHMLNGVYFVRALLSQAMGDPVTQQVAIDAFIAASRTESANLDLTLGRSSVLNSCALLLEDAGDARFLDLTPLLTFGDELMQEIWKEADKYGPVAESEEMSYLGIAHGWAGLLYATLRWRQAKVAFGAAPSPLPDNFERRLQELAQCALPVGRGLLWPWQNTRGGEVSSGDNGFMPGWCNGSAGHVMLWTLADTLLEGRGFLDLARKAAWGLWEQSCHFNNVCCGAAGCAYALLNLYRHTGDKDWLARARHYGNRVVTTEEPPPEYEGSIHSLYKGDVGLMVLLDDLSNPAEARMPLIEG